MTRERQNSRDRYRDNDDQRDRVDPDAQSGTKPNTKTEARGDAREAIGNTARDTDANPTGPAGNDRQRSREDDNRPDEVLPTSRRR